MTAIQLDVKGLFLLTLLFTLASGFRRRQNFQGRASKHRSSTNSTINRSSFPSSHVPEDQARQHNNILAIDGKHSDERRSVAIHVPEDHAKRYTNVLATNGKYTDRNYIDGENGSVSSFRGHGVASFLDKSLYLSYSKSPSLIVGLSLLFGVPASIAICWFAFSWQAAYKKRFLRREDDTEEGFSSSSEDSNSGTMFVPQLSEKLLGDSTFVDVKFIQPEWTTVALGRVLDQYKISTQFCEPDHLDYMACELMEGKARLCREGKTLSRVLDVVVVILSYPLEELVIQEIAHPEYTRNFEIAGRSMKTNLLLDEDLVACAARCLQERLGVGIDNHIRINPDVLNMSETKEMDDMLPGIPSVYRVFVIEANVVSTDSTFLEKIGLARKVLHRDKYLYKWESIATATDEHKQLKLKTTTPVAQNGVRWNILNHSLVPVIPWTSDDVKSELKNHGITDIEPFGRSLESLLKELQDGKIKIGVANCGPQGDIESHQERLLCVAEEICAVLQSRNGEALVPDRGHGNNILRRVSDCETCPVLANIQKFANESIWNAMLRLSQTNLKLSPPIFSIEARLLCTHDVLSAQGNFLRRKLIVEGPMTPEY